MTIDRELKFSRDTYEFWRSHRTDSDIVLRLSILTHQDYKSTKRLIDFFKSEMPYFYSWDTYIAECERIAADERLRKSIER